MSLGLQEWAGISKDTGRDWPRSFPWVMSCLGEVCQRMVMGPNRASYEFLILLGTRTKVGIQ